MSWLDKLKNREAAGAAETPSKHAVVLEKELQCVCGEVFYTRAELKKHIKEEK